MVALVSTVGSAAAKTEAPRTPSAATTSSSNVDDPRPIVPRDGNGSKAPIVELGAETRFQWMSQRARQLDVGSLKPA